MVEYETGSTGYERAGPIKKFNCLEIQPIREERSEKMIIFAIETV